MDQLLNPDTGLMIWVVVTFLCLVGILRLFAWKPLLGAIEAREGRIRADREGAEKARLEAERIQKEFEVQMAGVHSKSKEILAAAIKDGEVLRAKMKAEAEADVQTIKDKTMADLALEKNRLVTELREDVASLSVMAAEKLMRRSVDDGVRKTVLDGFFKDLETSRGESR